MESDKPELLIQQIRRQRKIQERIDERSTTRQIVDTLEEKLNDDPYCTVSREVIGRYVCKWQEIATTSRSLPINGMYRTLYEMFNKPPSFFDEVVELLAQIVIPPYNNQ